MLLEVDLIQQCMCNFLHMGTFVIQKHCTVGLCVIAAGHWLGNKTAQTRRRRSGGNAEAKRKN